VIVLTEISNYNSDVQSKLSLEKSCSIPFFGTPEYSADCELFGRTSRISKFSDDYGSDEVFLTNSMMNIEETHGWDKNSEQFNSGTIKDVAYDCDTGSAAIDLGPMMSIKELRDYNRDSEYFERSSMFHSEETSEYDTVSEQVKPNPMSSIDGITKCDTELAEPCCSMTFKEEIKENEDTVVAVCFFFDGLLVFYVKKMYVI